MTPEEKNILAARTILGWKRDGDGFITPNGKKTAKVPNFTSSVTDATKLLQRTVDSLRLKGKATFVKTQEGYRCIFLSETGKTDSAEAPTIAESMVSVCLVLAGDPRV